jgi:hypothetical protein
VEGREEDGNHDRHTEVGDENKIQYDGSAFDHQRIARTCGREIVVARMTREYQECERKEPEDDNKEPREEMFGAAGKDLVEPVRPPAEPKYRVDDKRSGL